MKRYVGVLLSLVALAILCGPAPAAAAPPQIAVTSAPSQSSGGVFPTTNGSSTTYEYTITDGGSVTDSIPVMFCITGAPTTDPPVWTSFQVQGGGGGNLPGVTYPANATFTSASTIPATNLPVCQTVTIQIITGALTLTDPQAAQIFVKNINISDVNPNPATGPSRPNVNWSGSTEIHIRVLVNPATTSTRISCFITDSSGNFLTKCDGSLADQSGSDAGRFAIVANKKGIEVSTNPGQFYYNVLYLNSGSTPITVDVTFSRSGVDTKGTQAIHAALFAPPFSGITQDGFNDVNDGIPEGTDDQVQGITIPAGWTLWVDYHLQWTGLGSSVPVSCAMECPNANQPFSVTSTVTETGGHSETCTAGAWGYLK
jgi:hypothetical protein